MNLSIARCAVTLSSLASLVACSSPNDFMEPDAAVDTAPASAADAATRVDPDVRPPVDPDAAVDVLVREASTPDAA